MLSLSVNQLSTIKWGFEEDVLHYHEAGFTSLGIWYPKLVEYGEEKGAELLQEYDFSISSLTCTCDFTSTLGKNFRQGVVQALDIIQTASEIGAKTVVLMAGGRNGHTRNHAMRILSSALEIISEAALAVGVQIAIEPIHTGCGRDSFLNTIPQCLDMIQKIDSPNLGIAFDSYHLGQDIDSLHWLQFATPLIHLVQLGDAKHAPLGRQNRCMLGHGRVPLQDLVRSFIRHGYDGFYEIELTGAGVENLDYLQLLGESRRTAENWELDETKSQMS
jgi:sugar phosphate isomerase/epimerase